MPEFEVNQYHTYADRFLVTADSPEEANALMGQWYADHDDVFYRLSQVRDGDVAPLPRNPLTAWTPPLDDPDVAPRVVLYDPHDYVGPDGARVTGPDGEEDDFC